MRQKKKKEKFFQNKNNIKKVTYLQKPMIFFREEMMEEIGVIMPGSLVGWEQNCLPKLFPYRLESCVAVQ